MFPVAQIGSFPNPMQRPGKAPHFEYENPKLLSLMFVKLHNQALSWSCSHCIPYDFLPQISSLWNQRTRILIPGSHPAES